MLPFDCQNNKNISLFDHIRNKETTSNQKEEFSKGFGSSSFISSGLFGQNFENNSQEPSEFREIEENHDTFTENNFQTNQSNNDIFSIPAKTVAEKLKVLEYRDSLIRKFLPDSICVGTCSDMCPEKERYLRERKEMLSPFESDHCRIVKAYSRASADQDQPLPHELRPLEVLEFTMDYLLSVIGPMLMYENIEEWYNFMWDRLRSIQKDITQQGLVGIREINLVEKCLRFHIFSMGYMEDFDHTDFDANLNIKGLANCLKSLDEMYFDLKKRDALKKELTNESEFRSYYILLNLGNETALSSIQSWPQEILNSSRVKFSLAINNAYNSKNFYRFIEKFNNIDNILLYCLLKRHLRTIYETAVFALRETFKKSSPGNRPETQKICLLFGIKDLQFIEDCMDVIFAEDNDVFSDQVEELIDDMCFKYEQCFEVDFRTIGTILNGGPLEPVGVRPVYSSFNENGNYIGVVPNGMSQNFTSNKSTGNYEFSQNVNSISTKNYEISPFNKTKSTRNQQISSFATRKGSALNNTASSFFNQPRPTQNEFSQFVNQPISTQNYDFSPFISQARLTQNEFSQFVNQPRSTENYEFSPFYNHVSSHNHEFSPFMSQESSQRQQISSFANRTGSAQIDKTSCLLNQTRSTQNDQVSPFIKQNVLTTAYGRNTKDDQRYPHINKRDILTNSLEHIFSQIINGVVDESIKQICSKILEENARMKALRALEESNRRNLMCSKAVETIYEKCSKNVIFSSCAVIAKAFYDKKEHLDRQESAYDFVADTLFSQIVKSTLFSIVTNIANKINQLKHVESSFVNKWKFKLIRRWKFHCFVEMSRKNKLCPSNKKIKYSDNFFSPPKISSTNLCNCQKYSSNYELPTNLCSAWNYINLTNYYSPETSVSKIIVGFSSEKFDFTDQLFKIWFKSLLTFGRIVLCDDFDLDFHIVSDSKELFLVVKSCELFPKSLNDEFDDYNVYFHLVPLSFLLGNWAKILRHFKIFVGDVKTSFRPVFAFVLIIDCNVDVDEIFLTSIRKDFLHVVKLELLVFTLKRNFPTEIMNLEITEFIGNILSKADHKIPFYPKKLATVIFENISLPISKIDRNSSLSECTSFYNDSVDATLRMCRQSEMSSCCWPSKDFASFGCLASYKWPDSQRRIEISKFVAESLGFLRIPTDCLLNLKTFIERVSGLIREICHLNPQMCEISTNIHIESFKAKSTLLFTEDEAPGVDFFMFCFNSIMGTFMGIYDPFEFGKLLCLTDLYFPVEKF